LAVSENIHSLILSKAIRANHAFYEKKRWTDLHMVILDDDGIARIAEKLQALKMKMDGKFYEQEQSISPKNIKV
jgi:hypothetical protein